jgi:hypothetical protein
MRKIRPLLLFSAALLTALAASGEVDWRPGAQRGAPVIAFGPSSAEAAPRHQLRRQARRVSRRTARRTTRRVARRHSVAGCARHSAYYYCGGVYYRPIVENGQTVYIVVNP